MTTIEYHENEYELIKTEQIDTELEFKLVKFHTGHYGIIAHNPTTDKERVSLLSPEKEPDGEVSTFHGIGCKSFIIFARDAKKYMENSPMELVVQLGQDAPTEYREAITRDQAKTLYERLEICYEILTMRIEDSFHYKYGNQILTVLICINIILGLVAITSTLHSTGVI